MLALNTALLILCVIIFVAFVMQVLRSIDLARKGSKYLTLYHEAQQALTNMAENYMDAAKLIDIKRVGKMNVFTFARRDQFFIIEAMGVMSDLPDLWREQAGLKLQTFQNNTKPARDPLTHGEEITIDGQKFVGIVDFQDGTGSYWTLNGQRI